VPIQSGQEFDIFRGAFGNAHSFSPIEQGDEILPILGKNNVTPMEQNLGFIVAYDLAFPPIG
jgi:hypothetical protein